MVQRALVLLCLCALISTPALAQVAPNPTQQPTQPVRTSDEPVALFRVTVVGHTTPAVNYRPRTGDTLLDFKGTALLPKAKGKARIEGEKGYIEIDAKFDDLEPATRFGREYLTYVLWAITPEGRATNLGELQVNGDDGRLHVTTELQAFALIVTAEPYFAVTQPSDVVVVENVVREGLWDNTSGRVEPLQAKFDLLKRGTYLMNQDPSALRTKAPEPGVPLDLAQARNAVEIARLAGADRYAADTFAKASTLLAEAEETREHRGKKDAIMMPARQAAQTAEDARIIALQRQEEEHQARQRALAQQREADALARARAEEERARAEASRAAVADAARTAADAARAAAERDRLEAERQRAEADRVRADAERARLEAERAKTDADAARQAADAARAAAEAQAAQARTATEQAEREKAELRDQLRTQLNAVLETRESARGLIVNMSDVLFDTARANLKPGAREKLARVAGIIQSHPGLKLSIEGHTDSVGSDDYNQNLSERRAESVRSYLVQQGITQGAVGTAGFGESRPVATNGTASGRQQNRRVEIVVSGESIGAR